MASQDEATKEAHALFQKLKDATDCTSLIKQHLTQQVFDQLLPVRTKLGGTLADTIRSGCINLESLVGIYATDPESYTVFNAIFEPVIKGFHCIPQEQPLYHPTPDFGDLNNLGFGNLDPDNKIIISTRVRVARCHKDYPFPPVTSFDQRMKMEKMSVDALKTLTGELEGEYLPIPKMSEETMQQLIKDHYLFSNVSRFRQVVHGFRDWPHGRGIYINPTKTFLSWINEGDHMRFVSMQMGGDVAQVYTRLATAVRHLEKHMPFATDPRLGYVTFCPSNLGTSMRASVHIKIPKLSANKAKFDDVCQRHNLQARGIYGEHTESEGGVYDISNQQRLGKTEFELISGMVKGVQEVIKIENAL